MQIINLVNAEVSDIKYTIIEFPDGESHLKLTSEVDRKKPVQVVCRICNPRDLFIICQVADILDRMGVVWTLDILYLMSMRMDRVISFNESFSLSVVSKVLNLYHQKQVTILEPHSFRTLEEVKNSKSISINVQNIIKDKNIILVFPDDGACQRYSERFGNNYPILTCKKVRDLETGKLLKFEIENPESIKDVPENYEFFVMDDLCDGGGTFIGIANLLKEIAPERKRNIFVTHLVNPKGIESMCDNYDEVTVTNSYKDWETDKSNFNIIKLA